MSTNPPAPPIAPTLPPPDATDEQFTLAFLNVHEVPCPGCGYNVHSLPAARCPECGLGLKVSVVSVDRINTAWLVLMITAAAGAGVGLLVAAVVWREGWPRGSDSRDIIFHIVLPYFLAMIPAPLLVMQSRRKLARAQPEVQWFIALGVAVLRAGMLALFLWNIGRV